ncbi:hypothetical protein ABZP36_003816 [Zizania latifolia]
MGNVVNTVKRLSGKNADAIPFWRCSYLPNGTPRLDKCTCGDNDSSVMEQSASAINGGINGHGTFYKEVGNEELHLAADSTSKSEGLGDINCFTLPIAHMDPSGGDEANKNSETQNGTIHTDSRKNGDANNSYYAVLICNRTAGHMSHKLDDESTKKSGSLTAVVPEVFVSTVSPEKRFCANHKAAEDLENTPAMDTHMSKRSRLHRISPSYSLFDHEVCDELIDGACNLGRKSTPEDSVHNEMAPNEVTPPYALRGCESTPNASLKRRVNRKRTNHEASHQTTAPNENTGALVPSDAKCLETVIQPPLTRTKTKALSIATPESLKLRSSRSGRLIVPRLDPGCQNIIYDMDSSICGVTNLELPCMLQGSNSGPYLEPLSKRRKRSRYSSPRHNKLLLF